MPIEFNCTQCSQLLRVPDDSAGKSARCPKCQALMVVPAPAGETSGPPAGFSLPLPANPFAGPPATGNPFSSSSEAVNSFAGSPPPPKPPENPFADKSAPNPYASPAGGYEQAPFAPADLPITNVPVSFDAVWNHALRVWQANIGILVVVTLILFAVSIGIMIPFVVLQEVAVKDHDGREVLKLIANVLSNLAQLYLGIGEAVICLKLARGRPASIGELFSGGMRFFPVLGFAFLAGLAILACLVPGIIFLLYFWPCYYLLIERRATFFESFSVAARITEGNRATTFLIWLVSVGVGLLGCCALYIGLLFALPLISVMWATAYLMMSGQLAPQPMYARY